MQAMVLPKICNLRMCPHPLRNEEIPKPTPYKNEILIKVSACGVCHTELDEIEGRTMPSELPVVLGHQVIGEIEELGENVSSFSLKDRVGVGWIYSSCGNCRLCREGKENLCTNFKATGRDNNGGYAEFMKISENFAFRIPENINSVEAAPLLCAGAIGYRSLKLTGLKNKQNIGLTGFGASGHLVIKLIKHQFPDSDIYVFARNPLQRQLATELGATWTGSIDTSPPEKLSAVIDTTPVWRPVIKALENLQPGGRLVINAIRKQDEDKNLLPELSYEKHLWQEKEIKSVANVCRKDIQEFLKMASKININPVVEEYSLDKANDALQDLKTKKNQGAKVLKIN